MNDKRLYILEKEPVFSAILKLSIPMVMGMLVQVLYNLTDTFFVGKLNDPNQIAAVALTMPLFLLLMSFSGILGNGGASYLSRLLGERNFGKAARVATIALYSCIALGAVLTLLGLLFLKPLILLLGTSAETYAPSLAYGRIILAGGMVIMANFALGQLLRAEGAAKESMMGMLIGTVVNIVLNPIFIFPLGMGVAGSAVATIIGNMAGLAYYLNYYRNRPDMMSLSPSNFSLDPEIYAEILKIGIPASLNQILMSVASIICNNIAAQYGDATVAAMGVSGRIIMIPIFIIIGIAVGSQPLIGFSYGAGLTRRLKDSIRTATLMGTAVGLFFTAVFWAFSARLIAVFINETAIIQTGTVILNALLISLPFVGVQIVTTSAVQAMGKALPALFLSISRQGLIYIPALFILNMLFGFHGFIYSQAVTDVLTTAVSLTVITGLMSRVTPTVQQEHLKTA